MTKNMDKVQVEGLRTSFKAKVYYYDLKIKSINKV
jgi:hypothetical protein